MQASHGGYPLSSVSHYCIHSPWVYHHPCFVLLYNCSYLYVFVIFYYFRNHGSIFTAFTVQGSQSTSWMCLSVHKYICIGNLPSLRSYRTTCGDWHLIEPWLHLSRSQSTLWDSIISPSFSVTNVLCCYKSNLQLQIYPRITVTHHSTVT